MRNLILVFVACATGVAAFGQVNFECAPLGAIGGDPATSCEGIASDGEVTATGVAAASVCGFPTAGLQYLVVVASGPIAQPLGGPLARPLAAVVSEVRIPIPNGATTISFQWEFFNAEQPASVYADGLSVDVVDGLGALVANLVYADTGLPEGGCTAIPGSEEVLPNGPQTFSDVLPVLPPCAYLSVVVWNGVDDVAPSRAFLDDFQFDTVAAGCMVPCFEPLASLAFSSPSGPGCLQADLAGMPLGGTFLLVISTDTTPGGWLFGVTMDLQQLVGQINFGYPFWGPILIGGCGGMVSIGEFCHLPSGFTMRSVALGLPGTGLGGPITAVSDPVEYTIP